MKISVENKTLNCTCDDFNAQKCVIGVVTQKWLCYSIIIEESVIWRGVQQS